MEWISVKDELPPQNVKIKIKTFDLDGNEIEIPAVFSIFDVDEEIEAWVWKIGKEKTIARPTHWMLFPELEN